MARANYIGVRRTAAGKPGEPRPRPAPDAHLIGPRVPSLLFTRSSSPIRALIAFQLPDNQWDRARARDGARPNGSDGGPRRPARVTLARRLSLRSYLLLRADYTVNRTLRDNRQRDGECRGLYFSRRGAGPVELRGLRGALPRRAAVRRVAEGARRLLVQRVRRLRSTMHAIVRLLFVLVSNAVGELVTARFCHVFDSSMNFAYSRRS